MSACTNGGQGRRWQRTRVGRRTRAGGDAWGGGRGAVWASRRQIADLEPSWYHITPSPCRRSAAKSPTYLGGDHGKGHAEEGMCGDIDERLVLPALHDELW